MFTHSNPTCMCVSILGCKGINAPAHYQIKESKQFVGGKTVNQVVLLQQIITNFFKDGSVVYNKV